MDLELPPITHISNVEDFSEDDDELVEDECAKEYLEKYIKINKFMEEVELPFLDFSKEDNKIKSRFICSKEIVEVTKMDIPQKIAHYKGWIQNIKYDYKIKVEIFEPKNKQPTPSSNQHSLMKSKKNENNFINI